MLVPSIWLFSPISNASAALGVPVSNCKWRQVPMGEKLLPQEWRSSYPFLIGNASGLVFVHHA